MSTYIEHRIENNIGHIQLNRPQAYNALLPEVIDEISNALDAYLNNAFVRLIMLGGEGNSFCAGADIRWMKASGEAPESDNTRDSTLLANLFLKIHTSPKPVIAIAHGPVFGGGIGLMAACDIVVCDHNARFKFSEVRLGLTPSTIMPYIINRMGPQETKVKVLTAELFDAKQALKLHLVDYVVKADAYHFALNIAHDLLKGSPEALTETKNLVKLILETKDESKIVRETITSLVEIKKTNNASEGLSAFLEKREPEWG